MTGALAAYSSSYQTGQPYITVDEYKAAPTAVELDNLVADGTSQDQDGVLANCIARASSRADGICCYAGAGVLAASIDTEAGMIRRRPTGEFRVRTKTAPILEVQAFQVGLTPGEMAPVDVSAATGNVLVERQRFTVGPYTTSAPFGGGGFSGPRGSALYATWTYVSGWANTVLAADATHGDLSVTVVNPVGFYPGRTQFKIFDMGIDEGGSLVEPLVCTSVAGSVIGLSSPLAFDHKAGVAVSAFPDTIKEAVILLTNWVIKTRGAEALVMDSMRPTRIAGEAGGGGDYDDALELLEPYVCRI